MKAKKIKYSEGEIDIGEVREQHEAGMIHVCATCGAELIVAFTEEEAAKHKTGRGIFCPNDLGHVNVWFMGKRKNLNF